MEPVLAVNAYAIRLARVESKTRSMENVSVLTQDAPGIGAEDRGTAIRRGTVLSVLILVITVGLCTGLYVYGKKSLDDKSIRADSHSEPGIGEIRRDLLQRMDHIAISVT